MLIDFFRLLRARGIKVSTHEWLDLMRAMELGLAYESLAGFYHLCRAVCVKSEASYDAYDQCFAEYFRGVEAPAATHDELSKWLETAIPPRILSEEEKKQLASLDLDELRRRFEERLAEQKERHDGGNRWIGTGGTSPFGHGGFHPTGVRVGGEGGMRSAMQVASERRFRGLRGDATLDTRQFGMALKKLRLFEREGVPDEIDLDGTIDATARNAGDIELVMHPARRNRVKLLLLMDVGGSMTPYAALCERLFSAAKALRHFKELKILYFHNCVYDDLYRDPWRMDSLPTKDALREVDPEWRCLVVGDAAMSPYELTAPGGCIDYMTHNEEPGLVWLQRVRERLPRSVWLNPWAREGWAMPSIQLVRRVFPEMQPLTVDGVGEAVRLLRRQKVPT